MKINILEDEVQCTKRPKKDNNQCQQSGMKLIYCIYKNVISSFS